MTLSPEVNYINWKERKLIPHLSMEDPKRMEEGLPIVDHKIKHEDISTVVDAKNEKEERIEVKDQTLAGVDEKPEQVQKIKTKRVATLDAFRGLTIVVSFTY